MLQEVEIRDMSGVKKMGVSFIRPEKRSYSGPMDEGKGNPCW